MKNIVTIYYGDDWDKEIPIKNEATRKSFENWHKKSFEQGVEMYRSSVKWYDAVSGVFKKAWIFRDGKWHKIEKDIRADLIYDKVGGAHNYELHDLKMRMLENSKVFNVPLFQTFLNNKISQYVMFGEFMPKTFLALNDEEFYQCIEKIISGKVVIKKIYGSGGFGVSIEEKGQLNQEKREYPVLIQEFIQSTGGIPGFSPKGVVADLRMVYFNHKFSYALSRVAKGDSLFTNFHQGATAVMVPVEKIPEDAKRIVQKIVEKLHIFPKALYSIDLMFSDDGKPFVIEMNTTPGLDLLGQFGSKQQQDDFFNDFIGLL
ncbi:MAG: ATP-grasp domain-containing protein [Candidatus Moranbacteria bacterium]|nr:ATP-grasp domain-containing protein [Candidatus Moranbacteria bacterium]